MQDKKINEPNPKTDLLTLNKQIVEEISEELQNNFEGSNRYVDPFKRRDQINSKFPFNLTSLSSRYRKYRNRWG